MTIIISLATAKNKSDEQLTGLVYSLTPRLKDEGLPWYKRPAALGAVVLGLTLVLNLLFF